LVGFSDGRLFIRDADDYFRLYPGGRLRTDFHSTLGKGVADISAARGGAGLKPRFIIRRVRLELSGEFVRRLSFTMGLELGGGRIGDADLASPDARVAPANAYDGVVRPAEITVSYRYRRWLNATVGQFNVPFSMSNRTREYATPLMERNIAIRGFAVPYDKEIGMALWGEFDQRLFAYELGVFAGDDPGRFAVDGRADFVGRFFARPFAASGDCTFREQAQIGVSGRYGQRDQDYVDYDYPSIATGQGFVMWQPGYLDSHGRLTHILPSGAQYAIGGELRLPFDLPAGRGLDLRFEAYYVRNNTREAIDGYQLTNTERFGRIKGVGWYGQISAWVWGDAFVSGQPGIHRPPTVNLETPPQSKRRGLEVLAIVAGIAANYDGATREQSIADSNTPDWNIALYQFGGGLQFWYETNFRAAVNYTAYFAPNSGKRTWNQAVTVDDYALSPATGYGDGADVFHELGARLAVTF